MEANKTAGIKALVEDVLDALPRPYTEDVIEDVFFAIESNPEWLRRYRKECERLSKQWIVNNWTGFWTATLMDRVGERVVQTKKSTLIGSYSKLDKPAPKPAKKMYERDAAEAMSEYYRANRAALPSWIRECRELILELILKGLPADQAFAQAVAFRGGGGMNE